MKLSNIFSVVTDRVEYKKGCEQDVATGQIAKSFVYREVHKLANISIHDDRPELLIEEVGNNIFDYAYKVSNEVGYQSIVGSMDTYMALGNLIKEMAVFVEQNYLLAEDVKNAFNHSQVPNSMISRNIQNYCSNSFSHLKSISNQ